ncbi:nuclear transport factor 2 family protein [Micromonospora rifamycinica]|uniref:nuclear transport factor 2 family protein n=1 Tax=Micromonospora rifamycinica TaxID=291594 RepID=UPI002E2C0258|nr:nuclear transport factor 2 family protein [Micromonospora rifamycinica]
MGPSVEDRLAIHELVALHGHLMDSGEFGRMDELFCADVVRREATGWRIACREVVPRRTPLRP